MPTFRFRLQSLLRARASEREARQLLLAEAQEAQRRLARRRDELARELALQQSATRGGAAPGRLDVEELASSGRYAAALRTQIAGVANQEAALAVEIEQRRAALVAADREVRVLEKLRQRQHEQFVLEQGRDLARQLDEIAGRAAGPEAA